MNFGVIYMIEKARKIKEIIMRNLSMNVLILGTIMYFVVMETMRHSYLTAIVLVGTAVLYLLGGFLGSVRKYIPLVFTVLAVVVFLLCGLIFLIKNEINLGFVIFATPVIFFVVTGFDSINGAKCIPYCLAMFGAEFIFCFNGDTRAMLVFVAALMISVMFTNPTYTAMSKYVFTLFLSIALTKCTGIWHILNNTRATGLQKDFIENVPLYVVMVILGIVSLLMRERHPRIKSDRDKKFVPALKQWQAIMGLSFFVLVFWGLSYIVSIFNTNFTGITASMKMNLMYIVSITVLSESMFINVLRQFGFIPLIFLTMVMMSFVYKAYTNYRASKIFADKLFLLMMVGFFVCYAYFQISIPVTLLYGLMAGCVVNAEEGH